MKKILSIFILSAFATFLKAEDIKSLNLKCNFPNIGDTLMIGDRSELKPYVGKNGLFDVSINLPDSKQLIIATPGALRGTDNKFIYLPAVAGESVELFSDNLGETLSIKGSKFYQDYSIIEAVEKKASKEKQDFVKDLVEKQKKGVNSDSLRQVFNTNFPKVLEKSDQALLEIIKQYSDNEAVGNVIFGLSSPEKITEGYALLSEKAKNGKLKSSTQELINSINAEKKAKEDATMKQSAGTVAPDFTLTDINGKKFTLSSLKGKYVLLDFWGSWCVWCIKGIPAMKEYYTKYKGKYEIVGIDCNDPEDKWKAAVKEHELPWIHVYNERGNNKILSDYAVQGFPTKVLIGPDGKIVKTIVGEDPAFYTFLDELFGENK